MAVILCETGTTTPHDFKEINQIKIIHLLNLGVYTHINILTNLKVFFASIRELFQKFFFRNLTISLWGLKFLHWYILVVWLRHARIRKWPALSLNETGRITSNHKKNNWWKIGLIDWKLSNFRYFGWVGRGCLATTILKIIIIISSTFLIVMICNGREDQPKINRNRFEEFVLFESKERFSLDGKSKDSFLGNNDRYSWSAISGLKGRCEARTLLID